MKNQENKHEPSSLAVRISLGEPNLLKNIVEQLAYRRSATWQSPEFVQSEWRSIETSTIEAFVSGMMILTEESSFIHEQFTTCFLFTCIKSKKGNHELTWASSLS
jgi:hypothetical protein